MNKFMNTFLNLNEEEFKTILLPSDSHEIIMEISKRIPDNTCPQCNSLMLSKGFSNIPFYRTVEL